LNKLIVHIVRHFCRQGGMENYVWSLTHELANLGLPVIVVCEYNELPESHLITVHAVERSTSKRRWRKMVDFRARAKMLCDQLFDRRDVIIHSHERSLGHDITTFHGELFDQVPFYVRALSPRIRAWQDLEREELLTPNVGWVLSVSNRIQSDLLKNYPALKTKKLALAPPGVAENEIRVRQRALQGYRCVFVGHEWRRKGLDIAVACVEKAREFRPDLTLDVFGVDRSALPREISDLSWIKVHGWVRRVPWEEYDLLIHLARREPFGMVVAEARKAGVPVLCSKNVGALDLNLRDVYEVSIELDVATIGAKLLNALELRQSSTETPWTWRDLALMMVERIYSDV
jgi:UDP-glucose:(heptosyl)LPS alpha-1,3-glucosyltransferase